MANNKRKAVRINIVKKLLILFCILLLAKNSYSDNITKEQLVVRDGIVYQIGSEKSFTGTYLDFHQNGQLIERSNYKNGKFHGGREGYLQNGQLEWVENYKNGKYHGLQEYFYKNGQIRWRGKYNIGKKVGLVQMFRPIGGLLYTEYHSADEPAVYEYFDKSNQRIVNGVMEYYFEGGKLAGRANIRNEKREGTSETFFQNGQLESRGTYKKGERHGLYEYYYKNGQVWEKSNFKNGKKDGLSQNFDEDGNLTKADYHKDGNLLINN